MTIRSLIIKPIRKPAISRKRIESYRDTLSKEAMIR